MLLIFSRHTEEWQVIRGEVTDSVEANVVATVHLNICALTLCLATTNTQSPV